jgi:hypothetical protein
MIAIIALLKDSYPLNFILAGAWIMLLLLTISSVCVIILTRIQSLFLESEKHLDIENGKMPEASATGTRIMLISHAAAITLVLGIVAAIISSRFDSSILENMRDIEMCRRVILVVWMLRGMIGGSVTSEIWHRLVF